MCVFKYSAILYLFLFFFFNDTATTEIYTLSLHDALPISEKLNGHNDVEFAEPDYLVYALESVAQKSINTAVRSEEHTSELQSHSFISYAVFCLKKKNTMTI